MTSIDRSRWNELSPLLDEVLELDGPERGPWLAALRSSRPQVAEELELLLGELQNLDATGFLQGDPSRLLSQGPETGQTIKLLNFTPVGQSGEERFVREGRLLSKLQHPNIARILDAGVAPGGQPYLVLERVQGRPIDVYCDECRLSVRERIRLFLAVLSAVSHAHANLVIHRDLKPANVLVTRAGNVKLLGFGITSLVQQEDASSTGNSLTAAPAVESVPVYTSPEQVLGEPVTIATDVYSLGVLLYILLTGQHPTGAEDASVLQHIRMAIDSEPSRVSDAAIGATRTSFSVEENATKRATTGRRLRRMLQGDLDSILARALKKNPRERYSSAAEFRDDLQRYLRNEPVLARADQPWYRVRRFIARNRLAVFLGATALLFVCGAAVLALVAAHSATTERDKALMLSSRNEAVAQFLNLLITEAAGSDPPLKLSDVLTRSEQLANGQYRKKPEQRAAVLDILADYYHINGDDVRAESLIREGLEGLSTTRDLDLRRKLTCDEAVLLEYSGKGQDVADILSRVIAEPGIAPETAAECLEYLAHVALRSGDPVNGLELGKSALRRLYEHSVPTPSTEAAYLEVIAEAESASGHNDLAEKYYQQAVDQLTQAGWERSPLTMAVLSSWANMSDAAGNPRRALELVERSLRISVLNSPAARPAAYVTVIKARALYALGRIPEAHDTYALCIRDSSPRVRINCLSGLTSTSTLLGDSDGAEAYIQQAFEAEAAIVPTDSVMIGRLRAVRAELALSQGRLADARADVDAAISNTNNAAILMAALLPRAELGLAEGKYAEAEADARRLLALSQLAQGGTRYSNRTGLAWLTLGRVLERQGKQADARTAVQTAIDHLSNTVDAAHPMLKLARELAGNTNVSSPAANTIRGCRDPRGQFRLCEMTASKRTSWHAPTLCKQRSRTGSPKVANTYFSPASSRTSAVAGRYCARCARSLPKAASYGWAAAYTALHSLPACRKSRSCSTPTASSEQPALP